MKLKLLLDETDLLEAVKLWAEKKQRGKKAGEATLAVHDHNGSESTKSYRVSATVEVFDPPEPPRSAKK